MEFGILILLVLINSLEDGFRDTNKKVLAHLFNTLHIVGWLFMIQYELSYILITQYVLLRFSLFDIVYNLIKGNKTFYIGNTSIYGKFWNWIYKITKFQITHLLFWLKLISLLIAISFLTY